MSRSSKTRGRKTPARSGWQYVVVVVLLALAVLWQRSGMPHPSVGSPTPERTRTPTVSADAGTALSITDSTPSNSAPVAAPVASATPTGMEIARVVQVIDGDTVRVELGGRRILVRYIGLDAPEVESTRQPGEPWGREAAEFNRALVDGREVYLEKDTSESDQYGRLLRYVWVDGRMVNAELIRGGMADGRDYPPDVRYSDWFYDLEGEARREGLGIWSR